MPPSACVSAPRLQLLTLPASSFLVEASALGTSRAACVAGLLTELNESVSGAFVEEEPARLVADPSFFKAFSLVIATQVRALAGCRLVRGSSRASPCAAGGV